MPALAVIWAVCHGRGGSFLNTLAWLGEGHHFSSSGRTGLGSDSPRDRAAVEGVPNIRKQSQGNLSILSMGDLRREWDWDQKRHKASPGEYLSHCIVTISAL